VSSGSEQRADVELVRKTLLEHLKVHVRNEDQGYAPEKSDLEQLVAELPDISAFGEHRFASVRVLLDWDHQLPSQFVLLRILASYDAKNRDRVDALLADRDEEIADLNLYPEFDVPDYSEIEASETYVAVLRPGEMRFEDFRFLSSWRKQVPPKVAEKAVRVVRGYPGYQKAAASRTTDGLGGPVVIGWAPPCLAKTDAWSIEIWLLTVFDGHSGKAQVFMVNTDTEQVTREFETDVQLA
jgi:hypothetical protein